MLVRNRRSQPLPRSTAASFDSIWGPNEERCRVGESPHATSFAERIYGKFRKIEMFIKSGKVFQSMNNVTPHSPSGVGVHLPAWKGDLPFAWKISGDIHDAHKECVAMCGCNSAGSNFVTEFKPKLRLATALAAGFGGLLLPANNWLPESQSPACVGQSGRRDVLQFPRAGLGASRVQPAVRTYAAEVSRALPQGLCRGLL